MVKKKYLNRTNERNVTFYPHYKYHQLLLAHAHSTLLGKSKTVCSIIKDFFDKLPDKEREKLMNVYGSMTEEERKFPGKL